MPTVHVAGWKLRSILGHNAFDNPVYELKNPTFNLADEMDRNFSKRRYTNTRTFIHANFNILPGWTASGQFQYEDIFARVHAPFTRLIHI